jgi:hypothetical protein
VFSGLFEALGKIGVAFVEALGNQPLALVLLVVNLALLTALYIGESNRIASRDAPSTSSSSSRIGCRRDWRTA